ncbi:MAG: hypothetical protein J5J00_17050, partial [Deltaproteobacteria bacterium]|nr:hypothetical protein [Deltaproteobacteria bacterium]
YSTILQDNNGLPMLNSALRHAALPAGFNARRGSSKNGASAAKGPPHRRPPRNYPEEQPYDSKDLSRREAAAVRDALGLHLTEMARIPVLSPSDEREITSESRRHRPISYNF